MESILEPITFLYPFPSKVNIIIPSQFSLMCFAICIWQLHVKYFFAIIQE